MGNGTLSIGHWAKQFRVLSKKARFPTQHSKLLHFPLLPLPPLLSPLPTPLAVHFLDKTCIDITLQKLWSFHNSLMKPNGGG